MKNHKSNSEDGTSKSVMSRKFSVEEQSRKGKSCSKKLRRHSREDGEKESERSMQSTERNVPKNKKSSGEEDGDITFKKCSVVCKSSSRKSIEETEKGAKRKTSPLPRDSFLGGTSSSSESENKKLSPDIRYMLKNNRSGTEKGGRSLSKSPLIGRDDDAERILTSDANKMSPSKEKKVSFEAKCEQNFSGKKDEPMPKVREDSLPPPDFEENYLIAQSDILRQASIEYDRRMQEHKQTLRQMKEQHYFDDKIREEFPDFETWMEEREKEESRKSSLDKEQDSRNTEDNDNSMVISQRVSIKPINCPMDSLKDAASEELSFDKSFEISKEDKCNEQEELLPAGIRDSRMGLNMILVEAEIEPIPEERADPAAHTRTDKEAEIFAKIREMITRDYLLQSQESLKELDLSSVKELVGVDKKELIKQNSLKEMRRELERKWLETRKKIKPEVRRSSEGKDLGSERVKPVVLQRRSLSFDEEILI
ncbi:hypothetical protein RUM44_002770 [Polyplax serrata]|uniref:Uncharacterized protein n=1 Tax=Polyplax serrata TaxID=468196 RepID=A0ABR1AH10_POLSC